MIDQDTTIDAASPIFGSGIEVIDGGDGPTQVQILTGGTVRGFTGLENSEIVIDGGAVTFLSSLQDSARLVLKNGAIGCTEQVCQVIDYDALFHVTDSSTLHVFGGSIGGNIALSGTGTAHVYGKNLALQSQGAGSFVIVSGQFLNDQPAMLFFDYLVGYESRIMIHNVPEPRTISLSLLLIGVIHGIRRSRPQ
ncbi:MAG: hypothetical protein WD851_21220 [Pirellulales bacterium]